MSPNQYDDHPFGVEHHGTYHEILNSEQNIYGGTIENSVNIKSIKAECNHMPYQINVTVPPFGAVLLETKKRAKKK